jgi:hypothetical protein
MLVCITVLLILLRDSLLHVMCQINIFVSPVKILAYHYRDMISVFANKNKD